MTYSCRLSGQAKDSLLGPGALTAFLGHYFAVSLTTLMAWSLGQVLPAVVES